MNHTPWVQQQHTNQTDTPKNKPRFIDQDTLSGWLTYHVGSRAVTDKLTATPQAGKDRQRNVLWVLAIHANGQGIARISALRIANDLGIDRRDVRNSIDALEQSGLVRGVRTGSQGKTNHYLVLPDYVQELLTQLEHGGKVGGEHGGEHGGTPRHKEEEEKETPLPPKTKTPRAATQKRGVGIGSSDPLVTKCVELDLQLHPPKETPRPKLLRQLDNEYQHLAANGWLAYPDAPDQALAAWCVNERYGIKHSAQLLRDLDPDRYNCPECKGALVVHRQAYRDEHDNWVNPGNTPCPECRPQNVTQIDTRKRVNTSTNTYKDIPRGTPKADTLSAIGDLAQHFTR